MEIVKIDAQKLQLLNDRINQTIDALNQVRLSTHGLQHSGPQVGTSQWAQPSHLGAQPQLGAQGFYGQAAVGQGLPLQAAGLGLDHSSPVFAPQMAQMPLNGGIGQPGFPSTMSPVGFGSGIPQGFAPGTPSMGLSHTSPVADPYWQLRAQQQQAAYPQYAMSPRIAY